MNPTPDQLKPYIQDMWDIIKTYGDQLTDKQGTGGKLNIAEIGNFMAIQELYSKIQADIPKLPENLLK